MSMSTVRAHRSRSRLVRRCNMVAKEEGKSKK
jgi:hypothetical protein